MYFEKVESKLLKVGLVWMKVDSLETGKSYHR